MNESRLIESVDTKSYFKYAVSYINNTLLCSGVDSGEYRPRAYDKEISHFSFNISYVNPTSFADALEEVIKGVSFNDLYEEITLKSDSFYNNIRIAREGRTCAITRGNIRIFCADAGALIGLSDIIRKEYKKYEVRE